MMIKITPELELLIEEYKKAVYLRKQSVLAKSGDEEELLKVAKMAIRNLKIALQRAGQPIIPDELNASIFRAEAKEDFKKGINKYKTRQQY